MDLELNVTSAFTAESTDASPTPTPTEDEVDVSDSYKWAAVVGGVIFTIFILTLTIIMVKTKRFKNKPFGETHRKTTKAEKQLTKEPHMNGRWTINSRCLSIDEVEQGGSDILSHHNLHYNRNNDLVHNYDWYTVENLNDQDDSDVLNTQVPVQRIIDETDETQHPHVGNVKTAGKEQMANGVVRTGAVHGSGQKTQTDNEAMTDNRVHTDNGDSMASKEAGNADKIPIECVNTDVNQPVHMGNESAQKVTNEFAQNEHKDNGNKMSGEESKDECEDEPECYDTYL